MSYCIFYIFVYFAYSDVQYCVLSIIFTSVFRDVRNGFRMQIFFDSSLPPDVCRRAHVLFTLFAFVCVLWCPTCIVLVFAWFVFDNYFTYFVPVFKYCYSDSRNL